MLMRWAACLIPVLAVAADFNREIRPILSDRCFSCHGPDEANRKAKLRLDTEAGARAALRVGAAGVPLLIERVSTERKGLRMPPVSAGAGLSAREVELLKQWVGEGAKWEKHWSFIPPVRPALPGIDAAIEARLKREGLSFSPPAAKSTLLRRVSLDLTGLPPTPEEAEAFLKDESPQAYERVVDRLLASHRYGERMAMRWLDAARYADTNGYQTDAERSMWRWRDWVIAAFNKNMPFNQFTVEQLAGDLLPNATRDQIIATGFNRNHRANGEGGSIGEEFLVEYAIDRVEATSTVWLGLTLGCARCHDHKYDPFTQREFYSMFAFFNNLPEKGKVFKYGNSPPMITAPTQDQESKWAVLTAAAEQAERQLKDLAPEIAKSRVAWEKRAAGVPDWTPQRKLIWQGGAEPMEFDGKKVKDAGDVASLGYYDHFTLAAWVKPEAADGAILSRAIDKEEESGYGVYLRQGKIQANFILRWLDDCLRVESAEALPLGKWAHVAVTYDGSREAKGIRIYVNGSPVKMKVVVDDLNQDFATKEPLRIGGGSGLRFTGTIRGARIYQDDLTPDEVGVLGAARSVAEIVASTDRTPAEQHKVEWSYLDAHAAPGQTAAWKSYWQTRDELREYTATLPTVMVMQERPDVRDAHILRRGAYDQPGEKVGRALPAVLTTGNVTNRLELAKFIVGRENPLTARVTVNRLWQMLFGVGIVKSVEDFGSQGEWPTHPELLDWLALEFVDSGWNVKQMLKTMVMSRTYQQGARITPELLAKDPENRLYGRGPRFRWPAEVVRDQALSVSGLLVEKVGGPSVKPYQPAGLWKELSGGEDYHRDSGAALYRRSLYTYWKRAVPPPGMMTFDAAGREACVVRENRTNTPLQALALMNDEAYLEAARKLAERILREGGTTEPDRLRRGFALALLRPPSARETTVLLSSLHHYRDRYQTDPAAAAKLLAYGESKTAGELAKPELAAWTMLASMILNLDETVTKE